LFLSLEKGTPLTSEEFGESLRQMRAIVRAFENMQVGDGLLLTIIPDVGVTLDLNVEAEEAASSETKYLVRITGNALFSGEDARWKYAFTEVQLDGDDGYVDLDGGRTGTTSSGYAINLDELTHVPEPISSTPWYVWGIDVHGASYPTNFYPRPVGGGGTSGTHKLDQIVEITERFDVNGDAIRTFSRQGSHDGECDEE
jgi:hypothetical protein